MNILRIGSKGDEVEKWQIFLRGFFKNSSIIVDGNFGQETENETKTFQKNKKLTPDGTVGPLTLSVALKCGYPLMNDPTLSNDGPGWPQNPGVKNLSFIDREKLFGHFSYIAAPTSTNPEAIKIAEDWVAKNITTIAVPQLLGIPGMLKSGNVQVHSSIVDQTLMLFSAWEEAGMISKIISWGGSWAPRFIRGSRTSLSNHAWGTAFDVNVQWNGLGAQPALVGEKGCVRELVEIAVQKGFYWGGWFSGRLDGMHFEAYKVL